MVAARSHIYLIGAYLPCRATNGGESEFDDALSQLREICMKYHDTHYIMIAADFNVDLMMTTPSSMSKRCIPILKDLNFSLFNCPSQPTFYHQNEMRSSHIDYIIGSQELDISIDILENDPLNTSPHIPVRAKLTCPRVVIDSSDPTSQRPRPQWDKADHIWPTDMP